MLDVGAGSVACEVWNGLPKGSAMRSDPAQPASKPADAPIRASRNATREQKTGMMRLMTQPTNAVAEPALKAL